MNLTFSKKLTYAMVLMTLLAIPVVTLNSSLDIIKLRQKDWYGGDYDPSYAYLYNSLNIANFRLVGHIDHPGTTTQVFGGFILKLSYLIDNQGESSLKEAVLKHPEFYLTILKNAIAIICSLMLFIFGWIAYRYTSNIWIGILVQVAPYISGVILFNGMLRFSQESMFMLASIAMGLLAIIWYERNEVNKSTYLIWFSIISGFGLASKIIFAPLMIIPLFCLRLNKERFRYLILSIVAFIVFTIPIIRLYPNMAWWFINLFIHSGIYGSGETNIVDTVNYFTNLKVLILEEPILLAAYIANLILLVLLGLLRIMKPKDIDKKAFLLTVAVFLTQTAGYLITAKHPKVAYLLPYECISIITLAIVTDKISKQLKIFWLKNIVSGVFVLPLAIFLIHYGLTARKQLFDTSSNTYYEQAWNVATGKKAVIGLNPGPSPIAAMFFANAYSRNRYNDELLLLFPDYYIFDSYNNKLIDWQDKEVTLDELKLKYGNSIAVIGSDLEKSLKTITQNSDSIFVKVVTNKVQVAIIKE